MLNDNIITAAVGFIDITPKHLLPLSGFIGRGPCQGIADPLEINAVVLRQGGKTLIFASADTLYITDEIKSRILEGLQNDQMINEGSFLFGATHTHFAPSVDCSKPVLGPADPAYIDYFVKQAIGLLRNLLSAKDSPVTISYNSIKADHSVNRRNKSWFFKKLILLSRKMNCFPNPKGPNDETIHTITLKDENDNIRAVIWNYACHPVGFPFKGKVSSDFPGVARKHIRTGINDHIPVLFYQGFSGNIRPRIPSRQTGIRDQLLKMLNGGRVPFGEFTYDEYDKWASSLSRLLLNSVESAKNVSAPKISACLTRMPLGEIIDGNVRNRAFSLQKIGLSDDLCFIGFSAETVVEYIDHIKGIIKERVIIPVGCINSVFGYLPTHNIIREGGYEGGEYFPYFNVDGAFKLGVSDKIKDLVKVLKKEGVNQ